MNARLIPLGLMLVVGIGIGLLAMDSMGRRERNERTVALVKTAPKTTTHAKDRAASSSLRPLEGERATALLAKLAGTTGNPDRIATLAEHLAEEVSKRRRLERNLTALQNQVWKLEAAVVNGSTESPSKQKEDNEGQAETAEDPEKASVARFLAAGIDAVSRAQLKKRASEIDMERLYLRHRASREGWFRTPEYRTATRQLSQGLREEFGDDIYDRFLFASKRSNRLQGESVMERSPAEQSGLQVGDIIVRYDGNRIFSNRDLRNATSSGEMGESVSLVIRRGSQIFELELPRGPLGVRLDRTSVQP